MKKIWLIEIRQNLGLSTYGASKKIGISQSYYSAIENGERGNPLKVDMAKAISKALNFDWTRFYEDPPEDETA